MVAARKILVVDDDRVITRVCRRILTEAGRDVETTESGREGLRRALSKHFDLVVTDLKMPDLNGMELVRSLSQQRPETRVIIITGYGTIPTAVAATKLRVSDFIEKPFTPEEILGAVNEALPQKQPDLVVNATTVKAVLRLASKDDRFGQRLLYEGGDILRDLISNSALGPEARAAIISGDIVWIEKHCGKLSGEEREWLERRLQAEIW